MSGWLSPLAERADLLGGLAKELRAGELFRVPLTTADSDQVWRDGPRPWYVGWLRAVGSWLQGNLAGRLGEVEGALRRRLAAFEEAQRWIDAGAVNVPVPDPPACLAFPPAAVPRFGGGPERVVGAFTMNPEGLDTLANRLGATREAVLAFGRRVRDAVDPLPAMTPPPLWPPIPLAPGNGLPPDAAEAVGWPRAFQDIASDLQSAAIDVTDRARALRRAATVTAAPPVLAAAGAGPAERIAPPTVTAGARAARGLLDVAGDGKAADLARALRELRRSPDYRADPALAAAVVNTLGADGLAKLWWEGRNLWGRAEDRHNCTLGRLVADASRSHQLDPAVLDALIDGDNPGIGAFTDCGIWDPEDALRIAEHMFPADEDARRGLPGAGSRAMDFLSRHPAAAARFVATHGEALFAPHMILHLKDIPDLSSEVGRLLLAAIKSGSDQALADSAPIFQEAARLVAAGGKVSTEAKQAVAAFLALRMEGLVRLVGTDLESHEGLDLTDAEFQGCVAGLVKDDKAWATLSGGLAVELRRQANAQAQRIADKLTQQPDLFLATEAVADKSQDDDQIGVLLGVMYQGVVQASDDAKEATARLSLILEIAASSAVSLVPVAGSAAANWGARALSEVGSKATGKAVDEAVERAAENMTGTSGKRPDPADFRSFVTPEVERVMAAALYDNAEIRSRLAEMGMGPAPSCAVRDGHLVIPVPADGSCHEQFQQWFHGKGELLGALAKKFVHSDSGILDQFERKVLDTTAGRTD